MNIKMKSILKKILKKLYEYFLKSTPSKITIVLMIINIILLLFNNVYYPVIVFKVLIYLYIANQINCAIYGECYSSVILLMVIPVGAIALTILDMVGLFDATKHKIHTHFHTEEEGILNSILGILEDPTHLVNPDDEKLKEKIKKLDEQIDEKTRRKE